MRQAGAAAGRHLKKWVRELGGSAPSVVMPSADVAAAARTAVVARTINNGQSCIAAKRFVVHTAVYDRLVDALVAGMAALRVGDPLDEDTDLGPLATQAGRTTLVRQVDASVAAGARLLLGGHALDLEVGLAGHQGPHAFADDEVVVGEEDGDRPLHGWLFPGHCGH